MHCLKKYLHPFNFLFPFLVQTLQRNLFDPLFDVRIGNGWGVYIDIYVMILRWGQWQLPGSDWRLSPQQMAGFWFNLENLNYLAYGRTNQIVKSDNYNVLDKAEVHLRVRYFKIHEGWCLKTRQFIRKNVIIF